MRYRIVLEDKDGRYVGRLPNVHDKSPTAIMKWLSAKIDEDEKWLLLRQSFRAKRVERPVGEHGLPASNLSP